MPKEFIIIMGVSGCGKSTIGESIVQKIGDAVYLEGDKLHPSANIEKMSGGNPLDDEDRWPWFDLILEEVKKHEGKTVFVGCSALKASYRDYLFSEISSGRIIYLKGDFETIYSRMESRDEHFMPASLLESQFKTLEEPAGKTQKLLELSVESPVEELIDQITDWI